MNTTLISKLRRHFCHLVLMATLWQPAARANITNLNVQIQDYLDTGCHATPGRPGAPAPAMDNPGGNQAECLTCSGTAQGMPIWWVTEPYINLWVADEPLSYTTSSGQRIAFRWTYHERGLLDNTAWAHRQNDALGFGASALIKTRYTEHQIPGGTLMTNASWQHNWWGEIVFWSPSMETNSATPRYFYQLDPVLGYVTNACLPYTNDYQALLLRGDGGVVPLSTNSMATGSGQISVKVINPSGLYPGPMVPVHFAPQTSSIPPYAYPAQGVFYLKQPTTGFQVTYPDGSTDTYGLLLLHHDATADGTGHGGPTGLPRDSTASAYLTARTDPQGRATYIGYTGDITVTNWPVNPTTNFLGYTVQTLLDSDGHTSTYAYDTNNWQQLVSITDPYGRSATFQADANNGFAAITDAVNNTSSFTYEGNASGLMTQLATPYATNTFAHYSLPNTSATGTNAFSQRGIYVSEPDGAHQLYCFLNSAVAGVPGSLTAPSVPGETFDTGTAGTSGLQGLTNRVSFHWGRRQFAALDSSNRSGLAGATSYLTNLAGAEFTKAGLKHWMVAADLASVTEALSAERDPSPDAAGLIPGNWTFYGNGNLAASPEIDQGKPITSVARLLPDQTTQYTRYQYAANSDSVVATNAASYTATNGTLAERTNIYGYGVSNLIDLRGLTNSGGQFANLGYNGAHQLTRITNALNGITTLAYDAVTANLTGVTLPTGEAITLTYNAAASPATSESSLLNQIELEPQGLLISIPAHQSGLPAAVHISGTGLVDRWLTNVWDGLNRLTATRFADGTSNTYAYTFLDLTGTRDRMGHTNGYTYDAFRHLRSITDPLGNVTQFSWCDCGALTLISNALGQTTSLAYDNQGNLLSVTLPDLTTFTNSWDLAGRLTDRGDSTGRGFHYDYNNQGLITQVSLKAPGANYGKVWAGNYDLLDRPHAVTNANGVITTQAYDLLNRLLSRTWSDQVSEKFQWANNGLIAYTNRDNLRTLYGHDGAGRVNAITNALLQVTQVGFNALGQVVSLTNGNTHTTSWSYDGNGWLTNKFDALGNLVLNLSRNANGWVTTNATPASGNTVYTYDNAGNIQTIAYDSATRPTPTVTFAYDALSRLTNMVDGIGAHGFDYTANGQFRSEAAPWTAAATSLTYTQGLRASFSLDQPGSGSAWTQNYAYDTQWRLKSLTSPAGVFTYGYSPLSPVSPLVGSLQMPNGTSVQNQYDALARPTGTALQNYWGHVLDGHTYGLDNLGLRMTVTRDVGLTNSTVTAAYDGIAQLVKWSAIEGTNGPARPNEQLGYGYDAAGNLLTRTNGALIQTFHTDAADQLTTITRSGTLTLSGNLPATAATFSVNGVAAQTNGDLTFAATNLTLADGNNTFTITAKNIYSVTNNSTITLKLPASLTYQYDLNGNLLTDGTRMFQWDAANQLTNLYVTNTFQTQFAHDGLGRLRLLREYAWQSGVWVLTNETRYLYDGNLIVQERDTNNAIMATYTRGLDLSGGLAGAGGIGGLLSRTAGANSYYYHSDGAGNITAMLDGIENVVARYLYDPFGRVLAQWGALASANPMQFSSMPRAPTSGLSLYPFRAYDPALQRWLNRDPIGENGGINLYQAMGNNPVNNVDPLGLSWYDWLNPLSYSSGYARYQGQQALEAQAKANGYKSYADLMDALNPDDIYLHQKLTMDSLQTAADITKDAANTYLTAATSVTPTGVGAKCVQAAVRTGARNLAEQMALREAEAGAGQRIMQGLIKDPAFPENVWAKMQHVHGDTTIHYWQNLQTGERIGFKFKD